MTPPMEDTQVFWICIIVSVVGVLGIVGIALFGLYLFRRSQWWMDRDHPQWHEFFHMMFDRDWARRNLPRYLADSYAEFLQRRNEFWMTYGQLLVAVLVIVVLTILLLTRTISAEAGLPILSGISGFAIGKGVSAARVSSGPPEGPQG